MRRKSLAITAFLGLALIGQQALADDPMLQEARQTAKALGGKLKGEMMKAMQQTGPVGAINFCNQRAPQITREVAEQTGWQVGRTSLKYRNAGNQPDAWEKAVLESFERRRTAGEPVKTLEHGEVVTENGRKVYRYMKAIPTGKPCLNCHGEKLKPEVAETLDRLYPGDRARGFRLGDIRGAFTLSKEL